MGYKIALDTIESIISKTYFLNDGDAYEIKYWAFLKERFPNCETFWRYFIVPLTKRIEAEIKDPNERISSREGASEDIKEIASFHYSMFLNLIYSYDHLQNFRLSSFEDFYAHLGSACDLAEDFLLKTYLLILECKNQKSEIFQKLKKEDFLKLAADWYDDNYSKIYEYYLKKGKLYRIDLPKRQDILDEYFSDSENWKKYKGYSKKIREYRNIIVHNIQIGKITTPDGIAFVPKKEKIQNYKKWTDVFAALQDIQKLRNDFINMKEQMILDIGNLEIILNNLWAKPIDDMKKLFYKDKNKLLLNKYNIDIDESKMKEIAKKNGIND